MQNICGKTPARVLEQALCHLTDMGCKLLFHFRLRCDPVEKFEHFRAREF
jgi:hypothetical protein